MDQGLRVVGFTFSNHGESTLNAEVSNAKFETQRSLLSELLAIHAGNDGLSNDFGSDDRRDEEDEDEEDEEDYAVEEEPVPVAPVPLIQRSSPISINITASMANARAKDAYRRLMYQRQVEHLHYQQQLQLQYRAQQQLLVQQQQHRRQHLQQQQHQAAHPGHSAGQGHDVEVQPVGPSAAVRVF